MIEICPIDCFISALLCVMLPNMVFCAIIKYHNSRHVELDYLPCLRGSFIFSHFLKKCFFVELVVYPHPLQFVYILVPCIYASKAISTFHTKHFIIYITSSTQNDCPIYLPTINLRLKVKHYRAKLSSSSSHSTPQFREKGGGLEAFKVVFVLCSTTHVYNHSVDGHSVLILPKFGTRTIILRWRGNYCLFIVTIVGIFVAILNVCNCIV